MLCVIDEFTREAPWRIRVKRRLNSTDVLETLADLMILRGPPTYVRSDNGPEFIAITLRAPGSPAVGSQTALHRAQAARGRMATARASTASCETNCSTARYSSPAWPRPR